MVRFESLRAQIFMPSLSSVNPIKLSIAPKHKRGLGRSLFVLCIQIIIQENPGDEIPFASLYAFTRPMIENTMPMIKWIRLFNILLFFQPAAGHSYDPLTSLGHFPIMRHDEKRHPAFFDEFQHQIHDESFILCIE